jgi:hypothetical protein
MLMVAAAEQILLVAAVGLLAVVHQSFVLQKVFSVMEEEVLLVGRVVITEEITVETMG